MFGKKSHGDKPAKKKSNRRKAANDQSRFGDGGIKMLFNKHVEKMAMAAIGLTALMAVFSSYAREGLNADRSPDQLATAIVGARNNIDQNTWDQVSKERTTGTGSYLQLAGTDIELVRAEDYLLAADWEPPWREGAF